MRTLKLVTAGLLLFCAAFGNRVALAGEPEAAKSKLQSSLGYDSRKVADARIKSVQEQVINSTASRWGDRLQLVVRAMAQEIAEPSSTKIEMWSGYYTGQEFVLRQYMNIARSTLAKMPKSGYDAIKDVSDFRVRTKLEIVVGELGERNAEPELRRIVKETENPYSRAQAIRALSSGGMLAKPDISFLKRMLEDLNYSDIESDLILPPELSYRNRVYFVRNEAFSALRKLGLQVIRKQNDYIVK